MLGPEKVVHCCICGDPNSVLYWQQLIRECPILSNIEPKQIKAWFQNHRCLDKQCKVASWLQTLNLKLNGMNKLLMEKVTACRSRCLVLSRI